MTSVQYELHWSCLPDSKVDPSFLYQQIHGDMVLRVPSLLRDVVFFWILQETKACGTRCGGGGLLQVASAGDDDGVWECSVEEKRI